MTTGQRRSGGCLCNAVRFEIAVPEAVFDICHCGICRKWSAGPLMAVQCPGAPTFTNLEGLAWYQGTDWAQRGFCARCGSSLFWRLAETPDAMTIVSIESFDSTEDFKLGRHIYVDAQPERYDFKDECPRVTETELLTELGILPQGK